MKSPPGLLILLALCPSSSAFQQVGFNRHPNVLTSGNNRILVVRYMQPSSKDNDEVKARSRRLGQEKSYISSSNDKRAPRTELLAATLVIVSWTLTTAAMQLRSWAG